MHSDGLLVHPRQLPSGAATDVEHVAHRFVGIVTGAYPPDDCVCRDLDVPGIARVVVIAQRRGSKRGNIRMRGNSSSGQCRPHQRTEVLFAAPADSDHGHIVERRRELL